MGSMPAANALWAGPGARRALVAGGSGVIELALSPGGYVRLGSAWLLLAVPRAPRGPLTLLVAGLERTPLVPGARVRIADGELVVEPPATGGAPAALAAAPARLRIELAGALGADVPPRPAPLRPGWRAALTAALEASPGAPLDLSAGLGALRRGELGAAVAALAGRGEGLTPAGDDALAGYAAWRHAAGAPVTLAAERASPIGLAYLRCAERGELPDVAARLLRSIRSGEAEVARRRSRALSRWGASSGAAILWGIAAGACS